MIIRKENESDIANIAIVQNQAFDGVEEENIVGKLMD